MRRGLILSLTAAACAGGSGPTAIEIPIGRLEIASNGCLSVVEGDTCVIVVRAFSTDGQEIGNPVLRWFTSNSAIAQVENGTVSARSPGQATITVSNSTGSVSAQATARVFSRPAG